MEKRLLMGNEAIAAGALRAGARLVSGYPGTPSTEILETVAKTAGPGVYTEWSVNEKAALEVAAGAAWAGARAMVTMKQVGLNVASDPLMSLNYVGIKGGLVVVVADDPGPISSQTEQDTRRFGQFAKLVVFDPATPEEAYAMMADAFALSEQMRRPVLVRPTTRVCHSYATVQLLEDIDAPAPEGFVKDAGRWVIFPRLSFTNKKLIEASLENLSDSLSDYRFNRLCGGGKKGFAAGGVSAAYLREALDGVDAGYRLLTVATVPFPGRLGLEFLQGLDEVLVAEELDPVIEDALVALCGRHNLKVAVKGKRTGHMPIAGENTVDGIKTAAHAFLGLPPPAAAAETPPPPLPARPPVLCAGCPHRASFFAVKQAMQGRKAVFSGDIGCYTLGNAPPLEMTDTCLCMGAGITVAQGLHRVEPDAVNFAFVGDSTFFHSGIAGIANAVYNSADIIVAVLDNYTTAMTGGQPHPGTGKHATGSPAQKISIRAVVQALGVKSVQTVNAFNLPACIEAVETAAGQAGVRVIIFEGPCIAVSKGDIPCAVEASACIGCRQCIKKLGCPAIDFQGGKAVIDAALCTGCRLCASVCPVHAIAGGSL